MRQGVSILLDIINTKMAAREMISTRLFLVVIVIVLCLFDDINATTVEVTVPVHPITVGGILPIQCQVWDMENNHKIKMFRVINDQTEELTTDIRYVSDVLGQRYFVTKRTMTGGVIVYFMTILDISTHDEGEYLCKVYSLSQGDYIKVAEGSVDVEIYFLPNCIYPQCQSTPAVTENMQVDVQLKLTCISSKGSPAVNLRWIDNLNQEITSRNNHQSDTVTSVSYERISHGSVFICELTSPGFPDLKRTCRIGPITVRKPIVTRKTEIMKPIVPTHATKQETIKSNNCNSECPKDNKYTILYLSVATVGASLLCVVFMTTTIIWCYKYHNISSEGVDTQRRNITSCDGSEPVYVSLQRRPEPERRSLYMEPERNAIYREPDRSTKYMSVEDPNNPGSKVLMPKEVFEEFYNSLSLKRV